MSKLYDRYKKLKNQNCDKLYLFKSGIFYIFLSDDAETLADLLSLKLTKLNDEINKCGFPANSLSKYQLKLEELDIEYEIIDSSQKSTVIVCENALKYVDYIKEINLNTITPLESFSILNHLQKVLKDD